MNSLVHTRAPSWPLYVLVAVWLVAAGCGDSPSEPQHYVVTGTVTGLVGTVILHSGPDSINVVSNGIFVFPRFVTPGSAYSVTVQTQPTGQTCAVTNGSGTVGNGNVTDVLVSCTTNTYTVGGTVTGLSGVGCVLQLNGSDDLPVPSSGDFEFANPLPYGASYTVTVSSDPDGPTQTCDVTNDTGTVGAADVTDVAVACTLVQPDCATATNLGSMSGDTGSDTAMQTGTGEAWYKVHLTEDSSSLDYLSASFTLSVPAGVDYDLYVYCGSCGGALAGSSVEAAGLTDVVVVRWEDDFAGDDSADVFVRVKYVSGSSAVPWTLNVAANVTATVTTCIF